MTPGVERNERAVSELVFGGAGREGCRQLVHCMQIVGEFRPHQILLR